MSWEIDSKKRYPCPCGKGEYEAIIKSDDWNRIEIDATMLCPECKNKYVWKEVNPSNRSTREFFTWVKINKKKDK